MPLYLVPKPPRHRMMLMAWWSVAIHLGAIGGMALMRPAVAEPVPAIDARERGRMEFEEPPAEVASIPEPAIEPILEPETPPAGDWAEELPTRTPPPAAKTAIQTIKTLPGPLAVARGTGSVNHQVNSSVVASIGAWSIPKPSYPTQARRRRVQGSGAVRVATDATGRVVRAEMAPGIEPNLDAATLSFARTAWRGPPNATRLVAITFVLE